MIIQLKYFHNSLNIAVVLAPCYEFSSAKCTKFPLDLRHETL